MLFCMGRTWCGAKRMNEIELIRAQLSLERQHAEAVARACASTLAAVSSTASAAAESAGFACVEAFRAAGIEYLAWILTRFEEREQVFHELIRKRFAATDPHRQAVEAALSSPGSNREALTKLEVALGASADAPTTALRWGEFLNFFSGAWVRRRDEIDRLFQIQARVSDWRTVSAIDADSIMDERARWARVQATLPAEPERASNSRHV